MGKTSLHIHTRLSRAYLALARLSCTQDDKHAVDNIQKRISIYITTSLHDVQD